MSSYVILNCNRHPELDSGSHYRGMHGFIDRLEKTL